MQLARCLAACMQPAGAPAAAQVRGACLALLCALAPGLPRDLLERTADVTAQVRLRAGWGASGCTSWRGAPSSQILACIMHAWCSASRHTETRMFTYHTSCLAQQQVTCHWPVHAASVHVSRIQAGSRRAVMCCDML